MLPSNVLESKLFINELARLFEAFNEQSSIEIYAIKAVMCLAALLLQKPFKKSKARDHIRCLKRRWDLWKEGAIDELVVEGEAIQRYLRADKRKVFNSSSVFSRSMLQGNVKQALRNLCEENQQGALDLDTICQDGKSVSEVLVDKHLEARSLHCGCVIPPSASSNGSVFHPVLFEGISADTIKTTASHTFGAAGPSGVNAWLWRRFCCAFGSASINLCRAMAAFCRRICCNYIDPSSLSAYTACRLLPLNKNPGVRPIGIAEEVVVVSWAG